MSRWPARRVGMQYLFAINPTITVYAADGETVIATIDAATLRRRVVVGLRRIPSTPKRAPSPYAPRTGRDDRRSWA